MLPTTVDTAHAVALSFNDGPSAYTPQVLHLLEHGHAHATFFVSGAQLAGRARILTRMLADGDEIKNALPAATPATRGSVATMRSELQATVTAIGPRCPSRPASCARPASRRPLPSRLRPAAWASGSRSGRSIPATSQQPTPA